MLTPPPTDIGICLITRPRSVDGRSGLVFRLKKVSNNQGSKNVRKNYQLP